MLLIAVACLASGATTLRVSAAGARAGSVRTAADCNYADAGSGPYARTLCWFDMSSYDAAAAASAAGQRMSLSLPGGYTITFDVHASGYPVTPFAFPTYPQAYLGNRSYTGVGGRPALYQHPASGQVSTETLDDIEVVNGNGNPITEYALVGADAETTDVGESITWTSDKPLYSIHDVGNACNSGAGLVWNSSTSVTCDGTGTTGALKTGTPMLAAEAPSTFSQHMVGGGLQGVAFGVLISKLQLTKVVSGRIDPSDAFDVGIRTASGVTLASAGTGTGDHATTGEVTALASNLGASFTLSESVSSGLRSNYTRSWSCTRNGHADSALPSGSAASEASVVLVVGDFVDCTITNAAKRTSLDLIKTALPPVDVNGNGLTDAGDTIAYTFIVTNTGELALHDVHVSDTLFGTISCNPSTLLPEHSATCAPSQPHTVTAADEAHGSVDNTATASGLPPGATTRVNSPVRRTSTPAARPAPSVRLTKIPRASNGNTAPLELGETIHYFYLVENTGNVYLSSVAVTDPDIGAVTCPPLEPPGLRPGQSTECTGNTPHTVTTADIAAGAVVDTAAATGTDPNGNTSPPSDDTATVPTAAADPRVAITKTATVSPAGHQQGALAGDEIFYSYLVTNIGNVDLVSVAVDDPTAGPVTCPPPPAPLAPGASLTCHAGAPHTVTQADVDAGHVTDIATARGTDTAGNESPPSGPATARVPTAEPKRATLDLIKEAAPPVDVNQNGLTDAGDTIAYTFRVTNTGEVALDDVHVNDSLLGTIDCEPSTLLPGESATCTPARPHTISAADETHGSVDNTATARGRRRHPATTITSPERRTMTPVQTPAPSVRLTKIARASDGNTAPLELGETIHYFYLVENTGNVYLRSVAVTDPNIGAVTCPPLAPPGLRPGESTECTGNTPHTVTAADIAAGAVVDTANATGTDPDGTESPPSEDTETVPTVEPAPRVAITKTARVVPAGHQQGALAGNRIFYSYLVTNIGNVYLRSVAVDDPTAGEVTCPTPAAPGLAPGAHVTCHADEPHTVTQADVDRGHVTDVAAATGTDTAGNESPRSDPSMETVPTAEPKRASLDLIKEAAPPVDVNQNGLTDAGDTIAYTFRVTNTGEVALDDVHVNDSLLGTIDCEPSTLLPEQSATCIPSQPHTVTAADEAHGSVDNTATARGRREHPATTIISPERRTSTPAGRASPNVKLTKIARASSGNTARLELGETIAYFYLVENTGNVYLRSITVDDPKIGAVTCPIPAPPGLRPGETIECTGDTPHTVTAADIAAGVVVDTANATGTDPDGNVSPPSEDTETVPTATPDPKVSVTKTATVSTTADQDGARVGDKIFYSYLVTNIGNVDLVSLAVDDPTVGPVTCPTPAAPGLAPGAALICHGEAPHTVTQADVDAGHVTDTATATGTDMAGTTSPPSPPSTAIVPTAPGNPSVSLTKAATISTTADQSGARVGDRISYSYVVTNTGNVTLASVKVTDPSIGAVHCPTPAAPGLAPGASLTCHADQPHIVTDADIVAGAVSDIATATGTDTAGTPSGPSPPATASVPTRRGPMVSIVKRASVSPLADQNRAKLGDTIAYLYDVTNTGDVVLVSVAVHDPGVRVSCPRPAAPGLEPHATITCTADSRVTVTRAHIAAGVVVDTATATGTDARGRTSRSLPARVQIPTTRLDPRVTLTKHATVSPAGAQATLGSTIFYSYTVTNVGNEKLRAVGVDDPTIGPVLCPTPARPGLATGQSVVCTARRGRVVTAADATAGKVVDRATAIGVGASTSDSRRSAPATAIIKVAAAEVAIATDLGRWPVGSLPLPAMLTRRHSRQAAAGPALAIPALGVNAPLVAAGAIGAPGSATLSVPDDIDEVAWWNGTFINGRQRLQAAAPVPGQPGVAIIAGHVASADRGPGAFYHLASLKLGDRITVRTRSGRRTVWKVAARPVTIAKGSLPGALFATRGPPRLALVTCGGSFDPSTGHYRDNVIVWAKPARAPQK